MLNYFNEAQYLEEVDAAELLREIDEPTFRRIFIESKLKM